MGRRWRRGSIDHAAGVADRQGGVHQLLGVLGVGERHDDVDGQLDLSVGVALRVADRAWLADDQGGQLDRADSAG